MKFTLNWLKEYLNTTASLDEIAATLTNIGLEVEEIEDRAAVFAPFKSAHVVSAEKHPDADRLKVCKVDTGEEIVQVVCGAPNAKTGMKGIFAPAGSYVPGTDLLLKKGKIRGQESNGMLVSEREMGISDEHDGIIELPEETEIGIPFADLYDMNDVVIEIGLTPNRADCAGIYGIARDLAAAGLGTLKPIDEPNLKGTFPSPIDVKFDLPEEAKDACSHLTGRYVKGVKNGPSPAWLQQKLKSIGLRPISILVDITNLMTIGYCRPLHVFDADKIKGDITVRLAKSDESFDALNDKSYTLTDQMTAITDDSGLLGLGGIVGGTSTGAEDDTVNVFVEAAYFDPVRIARTGRDLQVSSDARYRFERGVDPDFTKTGLDIATALIIELCGGEVSDIVETGAAVKISKEISYNTGHVQKLIGIDVPADQQIKILENLGCDVNSKDQQNLVVTTPSWRGDLQHSECLVEEVIRIHGLEHVEALSVKGLNPSKMASEPRTRTLGRQARAAMLSGGFDECVTWSFMPKDLATLFGANDNMTPQLTLSNPISNDLDQMRPSVLGNLIMAARENGNKGFEDTALFEIGPVFRSSMADGQDSLCTFIRSGKKNDKHWSSSEAHEDVDLYQIKRDVQMVLSACGAPETLQVTRDAPDYYHPGRSACLRLGKNVLATFGELHPMVLEEIDIEVPVMGAEIYLDNIPEARQKSASKPLLKISQFQPVKRDFALILDEGVEVENIIRAAKGSEKQMITSVQIFDVYQGKGVEDGKKSVALSVTLQPMDHTLTDSEIEGLSQKIISNIQQKTGGVLRG